MASTSHFSLFLFSLLLLLLAATSPATAKNPSALVLPVTKDASTLQYVTQVAQRTPLVPIKLTVDIGSRFMWVDCEQGYNSTSDRKVRCSSPICQFQLHGCGGNICSLGPDNRVSNTGTGGDVVTDVLAVQSTDGSNPGPIVSIRRFPFVCGNAFVLQGLASGVTGMAGLGITNISLPAQFASAFKFPNKFALCLSSSTNSPGVIFFGNGPYVLLPNVDVSEPLVYTPLIKNPVNTASGFLGEASTDYFIGVKSMKINGKALPINKTLLAISEEGKGGTMISTVHPYTVMETSIYKAFTSTFVKQLAGVTRVAAVAPFEFCYSAKGFVSTRLGVGVPQIDLVLQSKSVVWSMFGANSMVEAREGVLCLGFVDGGVDPTTSIFIGGHQMENVIMQFDLERLRLGFSNSLLFRRTTCANFNFTSNA
ncbi:eukaryotic aspartyl protease family protein [Actinidia rufa]|uniref:Eukaryotic aspartyl protease family protein n=1 Tax=Actinidia rufa TaxID=165716 RepID=A0A7J0GU74_9ERIC|nr:eukaryotic aspartyl protease family protein [Actinidia rufa]